MTVREFIKMAMDFEQHKDDPKSIIGSILDWEIVKSYEEDKWRTQGGLHMNLVDGTVEFMYGEKITVADYSELPSRGGNNKTPSTKEIRKIWRDK